MYNYFIGEEKGAAVLNWRRYEFLCKRRVVGFKQWEGELGTYNKGDKC
jgi:hypothetical protein